MTEVSRCRACGAFTQSEDRFCWSCGWELAAALPSAPRQHPLPELDSQIELALRRAYLAQRRGELREAERLVGEALAQDPESVSALSMLAEIRKAGGDEVGAVEAAQRAAEAAADRGAPPGALHQARQQRALIEQQVVRQLVSQPFPSGEDLRNLLGGSGQAWHRSGQFLAVLGVLGAGGLLLAILSALQGHLLGYLWFAVSLLAAGWTYHDAQTRAQPSLFWGPVVLCLGPFGLAVYLLSRQSA